MEGCEALLLSVLTVIPGPRRRNPESMMGS